MDDENENILFKIDDCITRHTFEMPSIITFIKMSNYEFRLYAILKEISASLSLFSITLENLSLRMQCDIEHVKLAKNLLSQPRDELFGMSLISVKKIFCPKGNRMNDKIIINDIHKLNIDLMDKRFEVSINE